MSAVGFQRAALAAALIFAASAVPAAANDLDRDEEVVFFPTYVVQDDQPSIVLPIQAWIYEPETSSLTRNLTLRALSELLGLEEADRQAPIFTARARTFLVDNERNQKVVIKLLNRDVELSASEEDGQIRSLLTLPSDRVRAAATASGRAVPTLTYRAATSGSDRRVITGRIHLIPPKGISIVSDVDDTIKISNVLDKQELLKNTFVREFQPVEGMAAAYDGWADAGAAFHYVSGSPRQLYTDLDAFRAKSGFPAGSFHLRRLRWKDLSSIREFVSAPEQYKIGTIETIMKACPERKFVLVGDSGEKDPEVYGELARRRPDQVAMIAIRNITDSTLDDARMSGAFREVPRDRLLLFRDAAELPSAVRLTAAK
jgi:phosphatidate phosphatase APP1